jgi:NADH-quinone oxidoreductase subunit J
MPILQPYLAIGVAAIGLLLMLLPGRAPQRRAGAGIGFAGVAWLLVLAGGLPSDASLGAMATEAAFVVFGAIALAGAVQVITQPRPVYAALFFVLVILSTCGLLLLLEAYFIAFAVVIVYAGAILITYMFVLMLAQQASDADNVSDIPAYDRDAREPLAATIVGTLLALVVAGVVFTGIPNMPAAATEAHRLEASATLLASLPKQLDRAIDHAGLPPADRQDIVLKASGDEVIATVAGESAPLTHRDLPGTTRHVGWDLVARFPASLEVAGVVLLMAMFGAVVLARRRIDLGEDALRTAAGLSTLSPEEAEEGSAQ